ncbi:hypothetical protein MKW92_039142 [Papaver armeniacum]|nr:hypothetical protein MKW92_039142 [Papaver armeniacum]
MAAASAINVMLAIHEKKRVSKSSTDTPEIRRGLYQSYFKTLVVLESRFPISPDKDQMNSISFIWYGSFRTRLEASQQIIHLEKAQECFFEKVTSEGRGPGLCAKVSRQFKLNALGYMWTGYRLLFTTKKQPAFRTVMGISCTAKGSSVSCGCLLQVWSGTACQRGDCGRNRTIEESELQSRDSCKENNGVYLMRVSAPDSLTPLPAHSLVKPTPVGEVLDASKEKMFASLVPDSSFKALSRYTEMVDDITQAVKLQQGSEITRARLKEMHLPESILALEGNSCLPMDIKEDVEAVQISGGPSCFEAELQQLKDVRRTLVQHSLNLKQAADGDGLIESSVRDLADLIEILDRQPIESALPTLARPIMSLDAGEDAVVGALKHSLIINQLMLSCIAENLGAQRPGPEDMLKEMKRKGLKNIAAYHLLFVDDISGSHDDLFSKEIAEYDHVCEEIAQNMLSCTLLTFFLLQAQNDKCAALFSLEDYKASRVKSSKHIQAAIAKFREIEENINEGLKFYVTLQQCSDFVMTRNIQCREMMEEVQQVSVFRMLRTALILPLGTSSSRLSPPSTLLSSIHGATWGIWIYSLSWLVGWGPYYNAHTQQAASHPPPPFSVPGPYPLHQQEPVGYYKREFGVVK